MTAGSRVKGTLKRLRQWPPLNGIVTSTTRGTLGLLGTRVDFLANHLPRVGLVETPLPDGATLRLWSEGDDWISNQMFWRGWDGYEREVVRVFYALAARSRVTLDIGAFVGTYSILAALANPQSHVFAFEPVDTNCARFRKNVSLNSVPRLELVCAAVGDVDGMSDLFLTVNEGLQVSCSTSLTFMQYPDGVDRAASHQSLRRVRVPAMTVDAFVNEHQVPVIDLVKIDTESTEPQVVRGMARTLVQHHPDLIVEVLGHTRTENELTDLLHPYGYKFFHLTPDGPTLRSSIRPQPPWDNYLITTLSEEGVTSLWNTAAR
jgi:FkbM family methyltransferase